MSIDSARCLGGCYNHGYEPMSIELEEIIAEAHQQLEKAKALLSKYLEEDLSNRPPLKPRHRQRALQNRSSKRATDAS